MGTSIWVIGNFIKKMDMEKKPGLMEILMKENLKTVKPMEKERIHGKMVIFTQVFLEKGISMAKEPILSLMDESGLVNSEMKKFGMRNCTTKMAM